MGSVGRVTGNGEHLTLPTKKTATFSDKPAFSGGAAFGVVYRTTGLGLVRGFLVFLRCAVGFSLSCFRQPGSIDPSRSNGYTRATNKPTNLYYSALANHTKS